MIKKFLYGFAIIAGLSSCNDDYTDWENPQSNAANSAAETFVLTVEPKVSSIDFATETAENIQLFTTNLQDGQTDAYTVTFSAEGKTEKPVLTTTDGQVASTDLQNVVASIFGKAPEERTIAVEVAAYVNIETADGVIVAEKKNAPFTIQAKLDAPFISSAYYLIGAPSAWLPTETSLPFNHSGKNVYDDPVFTVVFPVTDGETWFAVADEVTVDKADMDYAFGCAEGNGNNGMEGKLDRRSKLEDDGSWKVVVDGDAKFVKMTINMLEYTYKIEKLNFAEFIYEVGNNNNWGNDSHPTYALHCPNFDGIYQGAMFLKSGFKFRSNAADWSGAGNWGLNANKDAGVLINDGGSSDIALEADGFYKIVVDLTTMTYSLTPFTQLGIIGDGQPGGWDTDTPMTYDETEKCWVAAGVQLTAGKFIKFRSIGAWAPVDLGGSLTNLLFGAGNIPVTEDGMFTVKLFLETLGQPYATLTKE